MDFPVHVLGRIFQIVKNLSLSGQIHAELMKLCQAIRHQNTEQCIAILCDNPGLVNSSRGLAGYTPFLLACLHGNYEVAKVMVDDMNADVNAVSAYSESAFYLATYNKVENPRDRSVRLLNMLYKAGADVNAPNDKGYSPLQMAARFGRTNLVRWLLRRGASLNTTPSPYVLALSKGHQSTAEAIAEFRQRRRAQRAVASNGLILKLK